LTTATYVYGRYIDEVLTARRDGDGNGTAEDYFFHADDLYNVAVVTDATGAVVERYEYGAFGQPTIYAPDLTVRQASAVSNTLMFNGRPYDAETGFYYYRTRYLEPRTGRFTTRDTIGIWGDPANLGNGYAYVGNNPWTLVDPYGMGVASLTWSVVKAPFEILYDVKEGVYNAAFHPVRTWTGLRDSAVASVEAFHKDGYGMYGSVYQTFAAGGAAMLGGNNVLDGSEAVGRRDWDAAANNFTKVGIDIGLAAYGAAKGWDAARGSCPQAAWKTPYERAKERSGLAVLYPSDEAQVAKWASKDPLVADLANEIEALYPGHVRGVNVVLRDATGKVVTDADILLDNGVIQVKSGTHASRLSIQLQRSEAATGLPAIGYGPNLPGGTLRALSRQGGLVTGDKTLLLEVVKP
jgi:RHS repeat-associated protein